MVTLVEAITFWVCLGGRESGIQSHFFFFQAEDGIRDVAVTGVQTCALPISPERKVHPLRRKSHNPANSLSGLRGSMATPAQPVERFAPFSTSCQLWPASLVL